MTDRPVADREPLSAEEERDALTKIADELDAIADRHMPDPILAASLRVDAGWLRRIRSTAPATVERTMLRAYRRHLERGCECPKWPECEPHDAAEYGGGEPDLCKVHRHVPLARSYSEFDAARSTAHATGPGLDALREALTFERWWPDGRMVGAGAEGDDHFIADADSPDDAATFARAYNALLDIHIVALRTATEARASGATPSTVQELIDAATAMLRPEPDAYESTDRPRSARLRSALAAFTPTEPSDD
jgi:hypothetical protein